ncbi:unnamed protein product, partial [Polarella glacialis]
DSEPNKAGEMVKSNVTALDVLEQVRSDMMKGQRLGPLDGIAVDAVFINHGDMVLPFEWPASQARLLLREGKVLAGKHAVVTIHEVRDPYVLRVVAYDMEAGHEFLLHLYARDVALLLDTRDSEAAQAAQEAGFGRGEPFRFRHLEGPLASLFRQTYTVAEGGMLEVIVGSLSFSVFQNQQILVASEMRIPLSLRAGSSQHQTVLLDQTQEFTEGQQSLTMASQQETIEAMAPLEAGVTRGLRPQQRETKCLFEDVLCFEGRSCVFSLLYVTTPDLSEDLLRAVVYCPRTCQKIEVHLWQPMLSDRLRIVAEVGELDSKDALCVAIVVEEIIYPPAFVVRLTSISLTDAFKVSPQESSKPHSHVIRVSKDGTSALHLPDMSFAVSPSTMRKKLLRCIGVSSPVQGPRETMISMPQPLIGRYVTGHVNDPAGLRLQMVPPGGAAGGQLASHGPNNAHGLSTSTMPPATRAHLRAKFGKGRQLLRRGVRLPLGESSEAIVAVVSVFERKEPYQHFVVCAYEPQTSREWEVLADSIDVFKLFTGKEPGRSPALDLTNPASRQEVAEILLHSVELQHQEELLVISVTAARQFMAEKQ